MGQRDTDEIYMRRCLQLAANGQQLAKPNPMVGAVIASRDGRIIGEGYHVRCGEGHAEVNAFASVRKEDEVLLPSATLYVSLEPCSHYGKTPPCADLIIRKGVRRVVCGCIDPFAEVQGRGIRRIREAGIEVTVGVLETECWELNKRFITYNRLHRPYIILKWAQTENGYIGYASDSPEALNGMALQLSTSFTKMLVHKLRAENDAILVGRATEEQEYPQLNVRQWAGESPLAFVLSSSLSVSGKVASHGKQVFPTIGAVMHDLYSNKKQSLIVEGGARTLQSFIDQGLWDEIRVETAPTAIAHGITAPQLPDDVHIVRVENYDNTIVTYRHSTPDDESPL